VAFPVHTPPPSDFAVSEACAGWHFGPPDAPDEDSEMVPYRNLALAVLGEQIRAASHNPGAWLQWRREPGYGFWCAAAGLGEDALYRAVMRRLCHGDIELRREAVTRKSSPRGPHTAEHREQARQRSLAAWAKRKAVANG
jgi:hypothetical protein